ncbi:MAG: hypothetical protein ABGY42_05255 [bacterium]
MTRISELPKQSNPRALVRPGLRQWRLGLGLLCIIAFPASARESPPADSVLVRGEVVETGCFVIGDRHGPNHRQCAIACARAGQDLGILDEETGVLHIELRDQQNAPTPSALLAHVAERVEVRGRARERGGLQGIEIQRVRRLAPAAD